MQQRLEQFDLLQHPRLTALFIKKLVELRLLAAHQPRQSNGRPHIGQRIVGLAMVDAIGGGQSLQLEADAPVFLRPVDAFGAQSVGGTQQINQIPAGVAALPLAAIGVEEVAIQAVARHFVIEAQTVVTRATGARHTHLGMQARHKLALRQPPLSQALRGDASNQASHGMGQDIVAGLAIQIERFADFIQRLVGANAGHLQRAITARVDAGGFVVIPEDAGRHGEVLKR